MFSIIINRLYRKISANNKTADDLCQVVFIKYYLPGISTDRIKWTNQVISYLKAFVRRLKTAGEQKSGLCFWWVVNDVNFELLIVDMVNRNINWYISVFYTNTSQIFSKKSVVILDIKTNGFVWHNTYNTMLEIMYWGIVCIWGVLGLFPGQSSTCHIRYVRLQISCIIFWPLGQQQPSSC